MWTIGYDHSYTKETSDPTTDILFLNGISGISFPCLVKDIICEISGIRREIDENCDILDYHTRYSGSLLPTFRNNLSVPSLRVTYTVNICVGRNRASAQSLLLSRLSDQ
jgi:hypothetical protein